MVKEIIVPATENLFAISEKGELLVQAAPCGINSFLATWDELTISMHRGKVYIPVKEAIAWHTSELEREAPACLAKPEILKILKNALKEFRREKKQTTDQPENNPKEGRLKVFRG